ncbi:MAG: transporter substrate-binding domain-containing protein [Desulfovibrionaceae bacterium]
MHAITKTMLLAVCLVLSCGAGVLADEQGPQDLTYLTEEYYPFNYEFDGKLEGLSVDLLREAWRRLGVPEQPIEVLPWARAYDRVQTEPGTVLFAMARNAAREEMFRWAGPIASARFVLVGLAGRKLVVNSSEDLGKYVVGTVIKDISDLLLDPYKDRVRVEPVASMDYNIKKLLAGRIDLVAYEEGSMTRFLTQRGFDPVDFETVYLLQDSEVYFAFHKDTSPALVNRFQQVLQEIRAEPLYNTILTRHLH